MKVVHRYWVPWYEKTTSASSVQTSGPHPNFHGVLSVSEGMGEGLVPPRIQVFVNHFAFVQLLSFEFELHIRITGTCGQTQNRANQRDHVVLRQR